MASQPEAAARRPPDGPDHSDGPAPKKIKTEEAEQTGAGPAPRPALPRLDIAAAQAGGSAGPEGATGTPVLDTPTTPHPSREAAEKAKAEAEAVERERMQLLVSSFTEDQLDRYAMYRRAALPKATIKKVMGTITGTVPGHNVVIAMAGIAKVFAGEVVEEALKNLDEAGEAGQPLRPKHLREALRKMKARGAWVPKAKKSCPFN